MQQNEATIYITDDDAISKSEKIETRESIPSPCSRKLAIEDFKAGLKSWRVWTMLSYQDIKLRYRRSVLGPFWITLSMAITVYSMGYLYGHLFKQQLDVYFPFLVTGMLTWTLISSMISEMADGFVASEGLIKQIKLPYTLYMHRIACRNLIIFFHNLAVMIPIVIVFHSTSKLNWYSLLLIPGLAIVYFNTIIYGLIISMVGARYRDIPQVVKSLLQVIFFLTPIMWSPEVLGPSRQFVVYLNPLYAVIEVIRKPLLGAPPSFTSVFTVLVLTVVGAAICIKFFAKYRARIVYWL